jgi:hypothetical protein
MFNPKEKIVYNETKQLYECYLRLKPGIWALFGVGNTTESASQTADYWSVDIPDDEFIFVGGVDRGRDEDTYNTKDTVQFFYRRVNRIFDKKSNKIN